MPVKFALPDLGENIESGDVIRILVNVGDRLAEDQTVIELETDKAVIEVPSSIDGTITEILVQQGDTIAVGQPILEVDAGEDPGAEEPSPAVEEAPPAPTPAAEPAPVPMPQKPAATSVVEEALPAPTPISTDGPVPAAPSTRRLAREIGVDIAQVQGTGPGGRISIDDVKSALKKAAHSPRCRPGCRRPTTRLQPVGRCRAPAHDQGARDNRRASRAGLGHHPRRSPNSTRPTSPAWKNGAQNMAKRPKQPAAS